jgi:hypothetical protein
MSEIEVQIRVTKPEWKDWKVYMLQRDPQWPTLLRLDGQGIGSSIIGDLSVRQLMQNLEDAANGKPLY